LSRHPHFTSWNTELAKRFPHLPASVVAVLTLYSFGVLLARVCGLTTIVSFLAQFTGGADHALRKRLREFYLDAPDKSGVRQGQKRRDFDPATTFAPLLRWLLSLWTGQHLPLAIDVTNLGGRFHVLCVSVVVRGTAIPVAWKVLYGGLKEPWNPHWFALLSTLRTAVPDDWTVLVLSDRGLESPALFRHIVVLNWHPIMRVKKGGTFRPTGWGRFYGLRALAARRGTTLSVAGLAYRGERLPCTLLARWDEGYAEPWLLLTDLPPEAARAVWYGLRTWIEQGFKVLKSGGWSWDQTRMEDPQRVERLWLVLAVATLWVTALGIAEEVRREQAAEQKRWAAQLQEAAEQAQARQEQEQRRRQRQAEAQQARRTRREQREASKQARGSQKKRAKPQVRHPQSGATARRRVQRVSKLGLAVLNAGWKAGVHPLPQGLYPEPWPPADHWVTTINEQDFLLHQT